MANSVKNELHFEGKPEKIAELLEGIRPLQQSEDEECNLIDFNRLIPMPQELNLDAGGCEYGAIRAYLSAANPDAPDFGVEKLSCDQFDKAYHYFCERNQNQETELLSPEELEKTRGAQVAYASLISENTGATFEIKKTEQDLITIGKAYIDNLLRFEATQWYDWRYRHWGSTKNAYEQSYDAESQTLYFTSAWTPVEPIYQMLSQRYPEVDVVVRWAEENYGFLVGTVEYKNGQKVKEDIPEEYTYKAYQLSRDIWGYNPDGDYEEGYFYEYQSDKPCETEHTIRYQVAFEGPGEQIAEMLGNIHGADENTVIDFNKIVPMPEELDVSYSSLYEQSLRMYLSAVNPFVGETGFDKMSEEEFNVMYNFLYQSVVEADERQSSMVPPELLEKYRYHDGVDYVAEGEKYIRNLRKYNYPTWFEWRTDNWGVEFNAYHQSFDSAVNTLRFETVIGENFDYTCRPVLEQLSKQYPDVTLKVQWVSNGVCANAEQYSLKGGVRSNVKKSTERTKAYKELKEILLGN